MKLDQFKDTYVRVLQNIKKFPQTLKERLPEPSDAFIADEALFNKAIGGVILADVNSLASLGEHIVNVANKLQNTKFQTRAWQVTQNKAPSQLSYLLWLISKANNDWQRGKQLFISNRKEGNFFGKLPKEIVHNIAVQTMPTVELLKRPEIKI